MNPECQREVLLMTEIDSVKGSEAIKILSICSHILDNNEYVKEVVKMLDNIFNSSDFDIAVEFAHCIFALSSLNKRMNYYKKVNGERTKYILYAILYEYLRKHQTDLLNKFDSKIRIMFNNCWELLSKSPHSLNIIKESWSSCIIRKSGWGCCASDDIHIVG